MTLQQTITEAVTALSSDGYISPEQLEYWLRRLKLAAGSSLPSEAAMRDQLDRTLRAIYDRQVRYGAYAKAHPGVERFTIRNVEPSLRKILDRRIMASADLIKRNREQAIAKTLQRFSGWATSIPEGGSDQVDKVEEKTLIRKSMRQLPFEERRVIIDQGHKLVASINETIAEANNAIAVKWHSNWRQPGYDYRVDHRARDQKIYLLKGSKALAEGLVKPGDAGYYEDITAFAEEPFCRCRGVWIYNLRSLPSDMLTKKGQAVLDEARAKIAGAR